MEATIVYTDLYNPKYSGRTEVLIAENEDALFEQFYKKNNQLRYCNGCSHSFQDVEIQTKYRTWRRELSHERSFNLYYGNGVVD